VNFISLSHLLVYILGGCYKSTYHTSIRYCYLERTFEAFGISLGMDFVIRAFFWILGEVNGDDTMVRYWAFLIGPCNLAS